MFHLTPSPAASGVCVVIPVKDDAAALETCLQHLARQSLGVDEVIVVDNGSHDGSAAVARAHGATVIACAEPGIPAAAAAGYDAARSAIILRLDADCRPGPGWVRKMVGAIQADPRIGAVFAGATFHDGPTWLRRPLAAAYLSLYTVVVGLALGHWPLFGSNLAMRTEAWRSVRASVHRGRADTHDDIDLAFHLGERHRIAAVGRGHMTISMRPFAEARSFGTRVRRGSRTVLMHWPHDFPPVRWDRRLLRRVLRHPRATRNIHRLAA
ncbi:glycosyltransferase family 2 protein [Microbacterium sp. SSW1-59]|uniref:glycosyltransferase family A protein n=1 Tax=Microbacterium xanthum TaxID=3079794 RepID=UPI002AD291E6|nr:glycosyltransferase family 2 protein [Microbacterium sp. SSW1-59]MDZ8202595.1 glycosyltransferase family 2 protein [Microbacterium sp. SSW1-59]